jgi:hypothetical protein
VADEELEADYADKLVSISAGGIGWFRHLLENIHSIACCLGFRFSSQATDHFYWAINQEINRPGMHEYGFQLV